jgi:hypothetical protein
MVAAVGAYGVATAVRVGAGGRRWRGSNATAVASERVSESKSESERDVSEDAVTAIKTFFAECSRFGTWQRYFFILKNIFVECQITDTRQRVLCRVPNDKHSAQFILIFLKIVCRVSGRATLGKACLT